MSHSVDGSSESSNDKEFTPQESSETMEKPSKTVEEILTEVKQKIPKLENYLSFQKMGILFTRHEVLNNRLGSVRKRLAENQYEGNVDESDEKQVENFKRETQKEIGDITQNLESLTNEIDLLLPLAKKQGEQCLGQANTLDEELVELTKNKPIGDREKIQDVLEIMRNNIISTAKNDLQRIEEWSNKKDVESTNTMSRDEITTRAEGNSRATPDRRHVPVLTDDKEILPSLRVRLEVNQNYLNTILAQRQLPEDRRMLEPNLRGDALLDQEITYVTNQISQVEAEIKVRERIDAEPDNPTNISTQPTKQ